MSRDAAIPTRQAHREGDGEHLWVPDVRVRFGCSRTRARAIMHEAGAIAPAGALMVRLDALRAWEERQARSARGPGASDPPAPRSRSRRRGPGAPPAGRVLERDWYRETG